VKATVFFPEVGQKQLLLKFAKLDIIDWCYYFRYMAFYGK
jgi:hypothetical protein